MEETAVSSSFKGTAALFPLVLHFPYPFPEQKRDSWFSRHNLQLKETRTLTAHGRPFSPCPVSYSTFWPSRSDTLPSDWTSEWCTNKSSLPSSGTIKPYPFRSLNHFTVPVLTFFSPSAFLLAFHAKSSSFVRSIPRGRYRILLVKPLLNQNKKRK